jgi:UDP-N-acetylmuramyl pentapeptide phosphotransferase/UDP-N-acetylglucosamine-1-phosphate transferase
VAGYLPWDLRRKAMMGDTGSNTLGAALGWQAARGLPLIPKAVLTALLIGLNLLSEKVSFSTLIERSRFLHFLDQLGR